MSVGSACERYICLSDVVCDSRTWWLMAAYTALPASPTEYWRADWQLDSGALASLSAAFSPAGRGVDAQSTTSPCLWLDVGEQIPQSLSSSSSVVGRHLGMSDQQVTCYCSSQCRASSYVLLSRAVTCYHAAPPLDQYDYVSYSVHAVTFV